jgi:hypothetical protein
VFLLHHWSRSRGKEPQIIDPLPYTSSNHRSSSLHEKTALAHPLYIQKQLSSAVWCGFSYFFFIETAGLLPQPRCTKHAIRTLHLVLLHFFCQFLVSLPVLTRSTSGQKIMALSFCEAQAGFTETESLSGRLNNTTHARQPCKNTKRILFFPSQYITPPTSTTKSTSSGPVEFLQTSKNFTRFFITSNL